MFATIEQKEPGKYRMCDAKVPGKGQFDVYVYSANDEEGKLVHSKAKTGKFPADDLINKVKEALN